ncbi:MAG: SDR family NAD(P)-dependent oxidoreductase [Azospirillaceae bacterium]|nr:SDR family NAD(P)-dependent oxidoreductase [Azospirillaceae bacterium]
MEQGNAEDRLFDLLLDPAAPEPSGAATLDSDGLSSMQERLWLVSMLQPDSVAYHMPCYLRIRGRLDAAAFKEAIQILWRRHETLRTVFPNRDGRPFRVILPPARLDIIEHDFTDGTSWEEYHRTHASGPFALDRGPLLRVCLYRTEAEDHRLLLDLHHINGDGLSLEILRRELFDSYEALLEGRQPAWVPVPSYADFIADESRRRQRDGDRQRLEARIRDLADAPTRVAFPFDRPLPDRFSHRGAMLTSQWAAGPWLDRVLEQSPGMRLTPFMIWLAAFGTLLHRHSGQEDLLIGIPVSVRDTGHFERTIGFFVNTGVVRLDFTGDPSLAEVLARTRQAVFDMLSHPELPLDALAGAMHAPRTPGRPPVIQAALSFLADSDPAPDKVAGLSIERFFLARATAMFELTLDVIQQGGDYFIGLEYATDVWEEGSARSMLAHFRLILEAMAERLDRRVRDINLMPRTAREPLAGVLAGEALDAPARLVPDAIGEQARRQPDRAALRGGGVTTSFGALEQRVALRRGQLEVLGLRRGAVLALACAPGLEWTATALAALAQGVTVLPLDPQAPVARLLFILGDAHAALLWHDDSLADADFGDDPPCPLLNPATLTQTGAATTASITGPAQAEPDTPAYLIYTSGTTGRPKGVVVSHGAFAMHCHSAIRAYALTGSDRALLFAPMMFDAAWEQLFAPLVAGAAVLVRDRRLWSPQELCARLNEFGVTCADLPPQYLRELLFYWDRRPDDVPRDLRLVIAGGEAMPTAVAQAWLAGPLRQVPLINAYGPTEAVVTAVFNRIGPESRLVTSNGVVPIGRAMPGRILRILDETGREVGTGIPGELCIGGPALARGYLGDPAHTDAVFRAWARLSDGGRWVSPETPDAIRLYRTGDRVRIGPDRGIEFLGRIDQQIKLRGFRLEPGEIEVALTRHPAIAQAKVLARDSAEGTVLVAYCIPCGDAAVPPGDLAAWLGQWLPDAMIPEAFAFLPAFPTTVSGKIDVAALPEPERRRVTVPETPPADALEAQIAALWAELLGRPSVGRNENFFDLGGHSLLLVRLHTRLLAEYGGDLPLVALFADPTVAGLARRLRGETSQPMTPVRPRQGGDVAVIGMAGRFPGAATVDELWSNLVAGRESIRVFTPEELAAAGVPEALIAHPDYVPAHGYLEGTRLFDAGFFGYTPKDAEIIDPQQRLFLEEAWHALEHAGYDPDRVDGDIGVFGGMGFGAYLVNNLRVLLLQGHDADAYAISLGNDKDFITARVSYKLNLRGPSVNINTACSTSLVAIHTAAEALRSGACDVALAGGVTLQLPPVAGYRYQSGGIAAPDGHCRTFADDAAGTVGGSGVAVVVLKRLEQAVADGDTIHAVIKGSAINNDGADKVGFTAPGVHRQRDVIRAALDRAGLPATSIRYIEAHGTATPMGDPIEIQALSEAFAPDGPEPQSCYIGSLKSNIGHLDTAAGVAGFIKAVLAVEHGLIPASLHCTRPSRAIGFERTPFRVAVQLTPWPGTGPRRAGVSAFGIGGTNAHVILEQAPPRPEPAQAEAVAPQPGDWCIPLSARSARSLLGYAQALARHLDAHPEVSPADLRFTLTAGRRRFALRVVVFAGSRADAAAALRAVTEADIRRVDPDGTVPPGQASAAVAVPVGHPGSAAAAAFAQAWLTETDPASGAPNHGACRRIPLPGYVFDHAEYWIEPPREAPAVIEPPRNGMAKRPVSDWFYFPGWERIPLRRLDDGDDNPILAIHRGSAAETRWLAALRATGWDVIAAAAGPGLAADLTRFTAQRQGPLQCWHLAALGQDPGAPDQTARHLDALLSDIRALAATLGQRSIKLMLVAPHAGGPEAAPQPAFAYLDAVAIVAPQEYGTISTGLLRVNPDVDGLSRDGVRQAASRPDPVLLLSGHTLWRRKVSPLAIDPAEAGAARLRDRGVYLITGGLGGIGLALARGLARTCRARLALVSRHEPDAEQQDTLRDLKAAGAEIVTFAADIADAVAVRALVDALRTRWGRIDGVIHAAGVGGGSLIARTRLDEIERVLQAKVAGTLALAQALRGCDPDFVLLCSSLTAALGGAGQVAYAAANAWLDAYAAARAAEAPGRWLSLQWDSWAEVGMAARAGRPARRGADAGVPLRGWTLSPADFWPWGEHRVDDVALLPGTAYLDLFALALERTGPLELTGVTLNEPMLHGGETSRHVEVLRHGDALSLRSDDGTRGRDHARARLGAAPATPPLEPLEPLASIAARCPPVAERQWLARSGIAIATGPHWRIAGRFGKGADEALARLELPPEYRGDLAQHPLHPALLDVALSYYIAFLPDGTGLLPWRYESVRLFAPLTACINSHVRLRSRSDRMLVLDVDLRDEAGALLVQVTGYTLVRSDAPSMLAPSVAPAAAPSGIPGNPFALAPAEGIEVFLRALTSSEPVLCLSTVDWQYADRPSPVFDPPNTPNAGADQTAPARQPRPETGSPFQPAETPGQQLLAGIWAEVLGFDRIGIADDLFDLGADSLAALQVSARLKELTGQELSMSRFFDQPTIAHLALDIPAPATADPTPVREAAWEEGEL